MKDISRANEEQISGDHARAHGSNAFCGNAGTEEMKHLYRLLNELSDKELHVLIGVVGISFAADLESIDRDTLEGVIDEVDRELFYREYYKIIDTR